MKLKFLYFVIIIVSLSLYQCKSKKKDDITKATTSKPSDQDGTSAADDGVNDVNDYINNKIGGGSTHRLSAYNLPCGVISLDSTTNGQGKKVYSMKYGQSTPCGYKKKSGSISFALVTGNHFSDTGAVYTITFIDYVVEAVATGQTVKINGTKTITNVSGGFIWQAVTASATIKHRHRGSVTLAYNDTAVRARSYYQLHTWSSTNSWQGLTFTAAGDTTIGGVSVSEKGKTYEGNYDFVTQITQIFSWSNCGSTYAGPYVLKTGNATMNVTVPNVTPATFNIQAGYKSDANVPTTPGNLVNDCNSNAYKITTTIGANVTTQYQLY